MMLVIDVRNPRLTTVSEQFRVAKVVLQVPVVALHPRNVFLSWGMFAWLHLTEQSR